MKNKLRIKSMDEKPGKMEKKHVLEHLSVGTVVSHLHGRAPLQLADFGSFGTWHGRVRSTINFYH